MTYPSDFEVKLGFETIRQLLKSYCLSSLGTDLVDRIAFSSKAEEVISFLNQTQEFTRILSGGTTFPSTHYFDPSFAFTQASIAGSYLEEAEFLQIAYSIQTILSCREFLGKCREDYPELFKLSEPVLISGTTANRILAIIDESALVRDSASAELGRIRKKLRDEQGRLRKLIDQVYRYAIGQRWVPEGALPTIRGGRLVIPVLAEYKRKLKGFILDESATGQTVFMEPAEVLEANNEIRDLEHAEKREVLRILVHLTDSLRKELPDLKEAYTFLAKMDFIRAKAKLARELEAEMPVLADKPALNWMNARHPLLYLTLKGKRDLVPLNITLNESDRMLLVSGPNAGGKSVCLKTVGLLQYMLQCGILIPVSPNSTAGIFSNIFIDIGDQQSLENDLSTYSSHLKNLTYFIRQGNQRTLVLMDELGSGTDPNFGGAIAQAVLHSLLKNKIWGVATTHYYNLKVFADQQPGIRNAAMRFDEEKMVPLYILDIGKPGSSFALEIAKKTGVPLETLQKAQQLAGSELVGLETLVRSLEKEKNIVTEKAAKLARKEAELKAKLQKYEHLTVDIESRKKQILDKAKEEAKQLLLQTNREIEKTIRHIRENQAQKSETMKVRKSLEEMTKKVIQNTTTKRVANDVPASVKPGDRVRIIGQEGSGSVLSVKGNSAIVQLGELKSKIEISKLERADVAHEKEGRFTSRNVGLSLLDKRAGYSSTLDIRGKRVEEVGPLLDQFLDTSVLLGQGEIKILHGKGEGILRKVIREQLRNYKHVASLADEHVERGGDGITVVILK